MTLIPEVLPSYELTLPSSAKTVNVRPFVVGEEKLLLMALEAGDEKSIITTTKQIISNCLLDKNVNVDTLPFFDIDYLFIALRAKSVGETSDVSFKCANEIEKGKACGKIFTVKVDVSNCEIVVPKKIDPKIVISGQTTIKMKYPNYAAMKSIIDSKNVLNKKIHIIASSIDYIQQKDKVNMAKDLERSEIISFLEALTQDSFKKLEEFVDNFPSFVVIAKSKCPKCGFDHRLEYSDFASFFE